MEFLKGNIWLVETQSSPFRCFSEKKEVKNSSCCSGLQHELQLLPKYIENEIQFSETRNVSKNLRHKVWNRKAFHAMPRGMSLSKD